MSPTASHKSRKRLESEARAQVLWTIAVIFGVLVLAFYQAVSPSSMSANHGPSVVDQLRAWDGDGNTGGRFISSTGQKSLDQN